MKIPDRKPADNSPTEIPDPGRTPLAEIRIRASGVAEAVRRATPAQEGDADAAKRCTFNSAV
ncbi:hypothetical protein [Streptomyces sp. NPDC047000]|uniref:hypothetical protein n=1 Tax=Streptomyces sp. NPDC047000 TaxID=3155474 RepID=UPI0033D85C56